MALTSWTGWLSAPFHLHFHSYPGYTAVVHYFSHFCTDSLKSPTSSLYHLIYFNSPCLLSIFWCFAGSLWHSVTCRRITSISTFTFAWCSPSVHACIQMYPFYKDTSHTGLETHPPPVWPRASSATLFPNNVTSWSIGGQHLNIYEFWREMQLNSTHKLMTCLLKTTVSIS